MKTEPECVVAEFPAVVDLAREERDWSSDDKKATRTCYPCLYLPDLKGLKGLEEDGFAVIKYHVNRLVQETKAGETPTATVDLEIREIHLPEEEAGDDLASAMEAFAKKKLSVAKGVEDDDAPEETDE
jgi:hypothetical protein